MLILNAYVIIPADIVKDFTAGQKEIRNLIGDNVKRAFLTYSFKALGGRNALE